MYIGLVVLALVVFCEKLLLVRSLLSDSPLLMLTPVVTFCYLGFSPYHYTLDPHQQRSWNAACRLVVWLCRDRSDREEDEAVITAYLSMARSIEAMGLEGVWNMKPMFNGGEVKGILPNLPRGPVFSEVMNVS